MTTEEAGSGGSHGQSAVEEVAAALYALPPAEFVAARTAAARRHKADAHAITALRKPTASAWLVNRFARTQAARLEQLLDLGPALAQAQRDGTGAALRALGEQRRELVSALADEAIRGAPPGSAGAPSAAVRAEIQSTWEAALADPASAEAVRSGRLVRPLSYAGFGKVDLHGAVASAGPSAPPPSLAARRRTDRRRTDRRRDIAAAETRAHEAAGALDDAVRAGEQAQLQAEDAAAAETAAIAALAASEQAWQAARDRRSAAEGEARQARHRAEETLRQVQAAQVTADKARAALDQLRRS